MSEQSGLCSDVVPLTGIEPVRIIRPTDFKSVVSASSTTATKCNFETKIVPKHGVHYSIIFLCCQDVLQQLINFLCRFARR